MHHPIFVVLHIISQTMPVVSYQLSDWLASFPLSFLLDWANSLPQPKSCGQRAEPWTIVLRRCLNYTAVFVRALLCGSFLLISWILIAISEFILKCRLASLIKPMRCLCCLSSALFLSVSFYLFHCCLKGAENARILQRRWYLEHCQSFLFSFFEFNLSLSQIV